MEKMTNQAFFDMRAQDWDDENPFGDVHEKVARLAGVTKGTAVLDVACGTGVMVQAYLNAEVACITGIDISSNMIEVAKGKFNDKRVRFVAGDVLAYEPDELFDVAVLFNCSPHFQDMEALAQRVATMLREGGRFLVAHSTGREQLNAHHAHVAAAIDSRDLGAALEEAIPWKDYFAIDICIDEDDFYCYGGVKR